MQNALILRSWGSVITITWCITCIGFTKIFLLSAAKHTIYKPKKTLKYHHGMHFSFANREIFGRMSSLLVTRWRHCSLPCGHEKNQNHFFQHLYAWNKWSKLLNDFRFEWALLIYLCIKILVNNDISQQKAPSVGFQINYPLYYEIISLW